MYVQYLSIQSDLKLRFFLDYFFGLKSTIEIQTSLEKLKEIAYKKLQA